MISLDKNKCTRCGKCLDRMRGYCISEKDGYPVFDTQVCNICQKCVAICPQQAIMVNGVYPEKIAAQQNPESLIALFERRRSIKVFKDKPIPDDVLKKIVDVAKYAPTQNKNISLMVINDREIIREIDEQALVFVRFYYAILFGFKPLTWFAKLFAHRLEDIKRKMEYDLKINKRVVKKHTQALIIATGDVKVPVTEKSAHYLLATMLTMAESLSIGNTLMDSLVHTINSSGKLRQRLGIKDKVLGILALGYSDENIVNIPRGYEVKVQWNL